MVISYDTLTSNIYNLGYCRYNVRIVYDLIGLYGHLVVRNMCKCVLKTERYKDIIYFGQVNKLKSDKKM